MLVFLGAEGAFHLYRRHREDPDGTAVTEWWCFLTDRDHLPYFSGLVGCWFSLVLGAALLWLDVPLVFKLREFDQTLRYDWAAHANFFYVVGPVMFVWLVAAERLSERMHHPLLPEPATHLAGAIARIGLTVLWLIYVVEALVGLRSSGWELALGAGLLLLAANWISSGWIGSLYFWERHEVHRVNAHHYPLGYSASIFLVMIVGAVLLRGQPYGNGKGCRPLGAPLTPLNGPDRAASPGPSVGT